MFIVRSFVISPRTRALTALNLYVMMPSETEVNMVHHFSFDCGTISRSIGPLVAFASDYLWLAPSLLLPNDESRVWRSAANFSTQLPSSRQDFSVCRSRLAPRHSATSFGIRNRLAFWINCISRLCDPLAVSGMG